MTSSKRFGLLNLPGWLGLVSGLLLALNTNAQINFRVKLDPDDVTYRVSMTSATSFSGLQSVIATAQITLSVPHGTGPDRFLVTNLSPSIPGMRWTQIDRADAPRENKQRDYIFFGFINDGLPFVQFPIVAGREVELFMFKRRGNCLGRADLLNNESDPFKVPNSLGINTGNSMALLGNKTNAYRDSPVTAPTVGLVSSVSSVCAGEAVQFRVNITAPGSTSALGSTTSYQYQWFVGDKPLNQVASSSSLSYSFASPPTAQPATVWVRLTVAGASVCQTSPLSTSQVVTVKPAPFASIWPTNGPCVTFPATLTAANVPNATYEWFRDGASIPDQTTHKLSINESGQYVARLRLGDCTATSTPVPVRGTTEAARVSIQMPVVAPVVAGTRVLLDAQVRNAQTIRWSPATGLSSTTVNNPIATPSATTTYTLTASSAEGCDVRDTVRVRVVPPLYIPNAFTPNGDGQNDTWVIQNTADYGSCRVSVMDRWGVVVFRNDTYADPWDGRTGGNPVEAGIYFYTIQTPHSAYQGALTVLR